MTNEITLELDRRFETLSIYMDWTLVGTLSHVTGVAEQKKVEYPLNNMYHVTYHGALVGILWNVVEVKELW